MPTEKEIAKIELATLYELRLIISEGEKDQYSRQEVLELLDKNRTGKEIGAGNRPSL